MNKSVKNGLVHYGVLFVVQLKYPSCHSAGGIKSY